MDGYEISSAKKDDYGTIIKLHVKENNNLRDFYFRDIVLGEQDEIVYEPTNNAEIAFAFREAGEYCGS